MQMSPVDMMFFAKLISNIEYIKRTDAEGIYDRFITFYEDLEDCDRVDPSVVNEAIQEDIPWG